MNKSCWKAWRFGVALAAIAALLATFTTFAHRLEGLLPGWTSRFVPEITATQSLAVVAIDQASVDAYGNLPWSRDKLATVVKRLSEFKPNGIGIMLPLAGTETPRGLGDLGGQIENLDESLRGQAAAWLRQLDTDAQLSAALRDAGTVVLAAPYTTGDAPPSLAQEAQRFALETSTPLHAWHTSAWRLLSSGRTLNHHDVTLPARIFNESASGVGLVPAPGNGRHVQGIPLAVEAEGHFLPAFELVLLAAAKHPDRRNFSVDPQTAVLAAGDAALGAPGFAYYPRPATAPPLYSLTDIMGNDALAHRLRGKTVLLGVSAPGLAPELIGPAQRAYTPLTWSAQVLDSMLQGSAFAKPEWFFAAQRGLLVLFALYLILLPAKWLGRRGLVAAGLLAAVMLNAGVVTLLVKNLWLPVMTPALFLLMTQSLLSLAHRRYSVLATARKDAVEARIALAGNLQSQGQLDGAREQLVRCLPDAAALAPLYELGLEYERRRQAGKARGVYEQIEQCAPDFRDCAQRRAQLADLSERFPSASPAGVTKTLVLDEPLMELPVLGRYRLERELGRGAMGTVYLGTDPTIGRKVAVKTLPIAETHEGREQAEIAARFFQEAEAVGRLSHPNIVTVYDAGKEHDLAYIAMDYVPGQSLDAWTGESGLLPVWEVLEIGAQVAGALAYAHSRQVVHRDVKPANIIYDRDSGAAKITDFGIARMVDASRTRSGTVLGTPSYMSPEQVAGKKADGRSDLFSLGTTLYQLLTGALPFEGDSVATLMYQITRQDPRPIRKVRRDLPVCVARMIAKALQKEPAKRYADGEVMAAAILNCRAQFKGGRRKTA